MYIELISTVSYSLSLQFVGNENKMYPGIILFHIKRIILSPPPPARDTPFKSRSVIHQGSVQVIEMHL